MRVQQPLGEPVPALRMHGPAGGGLEELAGALGAGEVPVEGEVAPIDAVRRGAGPHRVEQGRGCEVRRTCHPHLGAESGLHRAGDGRLGDDQGHRRPHESTRAKSRAARSVPRTEPDTLDFVPAARGL